MRGAGLIFRMQFSGAALAERAPLTFFVSALAVVFDGRILLPLVSGRPKAAKYPGYTKAQAKQCKRRCEGEQPSGPRLLLHLVIRAGDVGDRKLWLGFRKVDLPISNVHTFGCCILDGGDDILS